MIRDFARPFSEQAAEARAAWMIDPEKATYQDVLDGRAPWCGGPTSTDWQEFGKGDTMPDAISQTGISPDPQTGRLTLVYLDQNGQKQKLDLTAVIEAAAAAAVKKHERDYHGGFD